MSLDVKDQLLHLCLIDDFCAFFKKDKAAQQNKRSRLSTRNTEGKLLALVTHAFAHAHAQTLITVQTFGSLALIFTIKHFPVGVAVSHSSFRSQAFQVRSHFSAFLLASFSAALLGEWATEASSPCE